MLRKLKPAGCEMLVVK